MKITEITAKEVQTAIKEMQKEHQWGKIGEFANRINETLEYPSDDIQMQIEYHRVMTAISPFVPTDVETQWQVATSAVEELAQLVAGDPEENHKEADDILLGVIERLSPHFGKEIRRAFEAVPRWYC